MNARDPLTRWMEPFFDVSRPYMYVLILVPLILFALGYRRLAVIFFLGAAMVLGFLELA